MDFMLYPYGNARTTTVGGKHTFTCQHGTNECIGNMYQACAIEHNSGVTAGIPDWWPFVVCMERARDPVSAAKGFASTGNIDWNTILTCAGSNPSQGSPDDGNLIMYNISQVTDNLQPAHQWTPWVVMNGKPLSSRELDQSLTTLVCNAYTGTLPDGCKKASRIQLDFN